MLLSTVTLLASSLPAVTGFHLFIAYVIVGNGCLNVYCFFCLVCSPLAISEPPCQSFGIGALIRALAHAEKTKPAGVKQESLPPPQRKYYKYYFYIFYWWLVWPMFVFLSLRK
jgi:hypothetical protein